jgi:hypothetical protein
MPFESLLKKIHFLLSIYRSELGFTNEETLFEYWGESENEYLFRISPRIKGLIETHNAKRNPESIGIKFTENNMDSCVVAVRDPVALRDAILFEKIDLLREKSDNIYAKKVGLIYKLSLLLEEAGVFESKMVQGTIFYKDKSFYCKIKIGGMYGVIKEYCDPDPDVLELVLRTEFQPKIEEFIAEAAEKKKDRRALVKKNMKG